MEKRKVYAAPNLMNLCVDQRQGLDIVGRIYYGTDKEPVRFTSAGYMILEIDRLCDLLGYPQPATVSRTFSDRVPTGKKKEAASIVSRPEDFMGNKGEEATFVLHIKYRQNATWQGTVTWAEENKSRNFRSALELLKLIDSALDGKGEETESEEQAG